MSEPVRSKGRIALGVFAIIMGCVSLVGLSSTSYYFGLGIFGGAYGAVIIALGVALIAKKEAVNLMSGPTSDNRRPSPIPRAVLAGLIAGLAAGLISYYVINSVLGLIIGFIAGAIVGSRTVLLMHKAREQDQ